MMGEEVVLRELAPREGFQSLQNVYETSLKTHFIQKLSRTGVSEIEVTSFVRADRVPQLADAEQVIEQLELGATKYTGLYLNIRGLERAAASKNLVTRGWLHIAASERFLKENSNNTIETLIDKLSEWKEAFLNNNVLFHGIVLSTAFGSSFDGIIMPTHAIKLLERFVLGLNKYAFPDPTELVLADTTGHGSPSQVRELIQLVRSVLPNTQLTAHFHDTRGTGIANILAALEQNIRTFECSLGGLGGCPFEPGAAGNVATEDVAYLCEREGLDTGYNFDEARATLEWFEHSTGLQLSGKCLRTKCELETK